MPLVFCRRYSVLEHNTSGGHAMNSFKIAMVIAVAALGYAGFGGSTDSDRIVSELEAPCSAGECSTALSIAPSSNLYL
jgi:hypothetical protein